MWIIPLIIVVAAVLGGGAYLVQRPITHAPEHPVTAAVPANVPDRTSSGSTETTPAAGTAARAAATVDTSVPPALPHAAKPAGTTRAAQKRPVEAPPAPIAPVASRLPEPPAPAPIAIAEAAAPAREAPAPDRWQVMADQINRCGRDGFFAGVVCEQRVRLKYCEGYWGQAAQCPSGIPNDHGQ